MPSPSVTRRLGSWGVRSPIEPPERGGWLFDSNSATRRLAQILGERTEVPARNGWNSLWALHKRAQDLRGRREALGMYAQVTPAGEQTAEDLERANLLMLEDLEGLEERVAAKEGDLLRHASTQQALRELHEDGPAFELHRLCGTLAPAYAWSRASDRGACDDGRRRSWAAALGRTLVEKDELSPANLERGDCILHYLEGRLRRWEGSKKVHVAVTHLYGEASAESLVTALHSVASEGKRHLVAAPEAVLAWLYEVNEGYIDHSPLPDVKGAAEVAAGLWSHDGPLRLPEGLTAATRAVLA